jgi:hypothetical protein
MEKTILLALAASLCTATASVCQRLGARSYQRAGFDAWLALRLARRPVWPRRCRTPSLAAASISTTVACACLTALVRASQTV